jgi:hypothetical protein
MDTPVKPAKYTMTCPQGSTLGLQFTFKINKYPVNLTGYSARMQVREFHTSLDTLISLETDGAGYGITLGGKAGTIDILIPSAITEGFKAVPHVYDLELIAPNESVTRILEGTFNITPEVTR